MIFTALEQGGGVSTYASGDIDLTGLTQIGFNIQYPIGQIIPNAGSIIVGGGNHNTFSGLSGPSTFGAGGYSNPAGISGAQVGITGGNQLTLWNGYATSGTISIPGGAYSIYHPATFSSLGLTAGTYHYTWGGGGPNQRITVQVGTVVFVPEPTTLLTLGVAGFTLALGRRKRRLA